MSEDALPKALRGMNLVCFSQETLSVTHTLFTTFVEHLRPKSRQVPRQVSFSPRILTMCELDRLIFLPKLLACFYPHCYD